MQPAGISVEGTVMTTRDRANRGFYGRPLTAKQLLLEGAVVPPTAARPLYAALDQLMDRVEEPVTVAAASRYSMKALAAVVQHCAVINLQ